VCLKPIDHLSERDLPLTQFSACWRSANARILTALPSWMVQTSANFTSCHSLLPLDGYAQNENYNTLADWKEFFWFTGFGKFDHWVQEQGFLHIEIRVAYAIVP
jgi:hypothetical protein